MNIYWEYLTSFSFFAVVVVVGFFSSSSSSEKVCMSPAFALLLQHTNIRHTSPKARNMSRENTSDEAKSRALDFDQRQCELRAYPRLRQALQNPLPEKHICCIKMPLLRLAKHHKFWSTEHRTWWWSPPRQRGRLTRGSGLLPLASHLDRWLAMHTCVGYKIPNF